MFRLVLLTALVALASGASPAFRPITPMLDGKIVGGEETTIEAYPYQVSLQRWGKHMCGGSVLTPTRVLTAAHCTDGQFVSSLSVRAGSSFRNSGGQVHNVASVEQHPSYINRNTDYDVSVLVLETPLEFGPKVQPIALAQAGDDIAAGTPAVVTGWGSLTPGGSISEVLHAVSVPKVADEECKDAYGSDKITERMTCHGLDNGGKDSCQGDSGGPLVSGGVQVGIVSWGYGCARPDYPGVYTDISNADINSHIVDNC